MNSKLRTLSPLLYQLRLTSSSVQLGSARETLPEIVALDDRLRTHDDVYRYSVENSETFWATLARSRLNWTKDFTSPTSCQLCGRMCDLSGTFSEGTLSWFPGGELNMSVNCLDRHEPDRMALIWETDEPGRHETLTYRELLELTCQMGNLLQENGIVKGSVVVLYLPPCPIAVATMLACARLGAVHNIVFAGFSAEALAARIQDAGATVVVTGDEGVRGGRPVPLKAVVDAAVAKSPSIKRVFVMKRGVGETKLNKLDICLEKELHKRANTLSPVSVASEDPLFMLYTSGSTGKPKGIVHSTAGYGLYASLTHRLCFDIPLNSGPEVIFGCMADIGWITGHSYAVYGPLLNGVTSVLFESIPTYPDPGRYWEMVERLKMSHFYTAPTAIRLLIQHGEHWPAKYDLSSLKVIASVGEPINHEAWEWYQKEVGGGKTMLVDTWWQTETGGICLAPCPAEPGSHIEPAMAQRPFYGHRPVLLDAKGQEVSENPASGALFLANPWPGMAKTIFGDHKRFQEAYLGQAPGYFCSGDGAERDEHGWLRITGRLDDVINVSGHRLGTAEIEDVLDESEAVAESAVVSFPHSVKGEGIAAFLTLKDETDLSPEDVVTALRGSLRKGIAAYAVPDKFIIASGLPKTRSGKIMRRILRKIAAGDLEDFGDISTLANPKSVAELIKSPVFTGKH